MTMLKRAPMTSLAAILIVVVCGVASLIAAMFAPGGWAANGPGALVAAGLISTVVTSLLALYKAERVHHDLTNGTVVEKTAEAIQNAVDDGTLPPGPTAGGTPGSGHLRGAG